MHASVLLFALIGLVFGSFGNVVIFRLHRGEHLGGRSHCPSCKRTLSIIDLVPVVSFVGLGGRCRTCRSHISLQYPIVEMLSAAVFALARVLEPASLINAGFLAVALYCLLLGSVFDLLYRQLPDLFTAAIAIAAVALSLLRGNMTSSVAGMGIAIACFGGQWILSRGRAVGTGDIFLAGALGILLGATGTISMILLSYAGGAMIMLTLMAIGTVSMKQDRVAFGPFLAMGTLLTLMGAGRLYATLL